MTFAKDMPRRIGSHLTKVGSAGAGYFKVLADLLTGRRNLFF